MQIPHEEARRLLQFNADDALNLEEKNILSTHLKACFECRAYAEEIKEVENTLLPIMRRQWNLRPTPLSLSDLKVKRHSPTITSNILAIRTAIISFVFVLFAVSAWQFTLSEQPGQSPVIVSPVLTPSIESTTTIVSSENCELVRYTVQSNDTLTSIADQFSISKDEIISINNLKTETIRLGTTLMIPVCNSTPTSVASPTLSTTLTPVVSSTTSSPQPNRY